MIDAIAAVSSALSADSSAAAQQTPAAPDFGAWLDRQVGAVNDSVAQADHAVQLLAVGQAESLPDVMISLENARMLSLMVQVRDRLVQGYEDVLRMQI